MPDFSLGQWLILCGTVLIVVGVLSSLPFKIFPFGRLPGDIIIQRENFRFYFPLLSCLLLSVILSLVFIFFRK